MRQFASMTSTRRKGAAPVLVTVILVSATLAIALAASFFAYTVLESQSEMAEFENAKSAMVSFAQMIEGLTYAKGSAAYTTLYIKSGGLSFIEGMDSLTINVAGIGPINTGIVNLPMLRGGAMVTSAGYEVLRGIQGVYADSAPALIIQSGMSQSGPLGWVYTKRQQGAWIVIDFGRIRTVFSGTNNYTTDGIKWYPYNTFEITYVRLSFGNTGGRDVFDIRARVTGVATSSYMVEAPSITVEVTRGAVSRSYAISGSPSAHGSIVNISIVDVEVSTM